MRCAVTRRFPLFSRYLILLATLVCGVVGTAPAGIRGPGKYCGVVIFDRWDTCFLLSGPYITYISEKVKNDLRAYNGKAMQIYASEVFQPENPGDALITKFEIIGLAPDTQKWAKLDGLQLNAESDFGPLDRPIFRIEIRNAGNTPVSINSSEIAPVVLGLVPKPLSFPSDGRSAAWITRGDLMHPSSWKSTIGRATYSASYKIDLESRLPERFVLEPNQSKKARITFEISPGQYQFMFGYGGGVHEEKSLVSNFVSFDLSDAGVATLAK
jgi:hypothetical protein